MNRQCINMFASASSSIEFKARRAKKVRLLSQCVPAQIVDVPGNISCKPIVDIVFLFNIICTNRNFCTNTSFDDNTDFFENDCISDANLKMTTQWKAFRSSRSRSGKICDMNACVFQDSISIYQSNCGMKGHESLHCSQMPIKGIINDRNHVCSEFENAMETDSVWKRHVMNVRLDSAVNGLFFTNEQFSDVFRIETFSHPSMASVMIMTRMSLLSTLSPSNT